MIRTLSKALASLLFSTLLLASAGAQAAGDANLALQGKSDKVRCDSKNPNCRTSATDGEVAQSFIRYARLDACPDDAPDCGARAKLKRAHAEDEVRDRHACRD
jgi:hypothetical protein